jgi:putative transcriptional regulator
MPDVKYGYIEILIDDLLQERQMSKNALAEKANLQRTQLNAYCNNKIKRPDFDVLSRICFVLDCEINDVLRYIKPHNEGQV